MLKTIFHLLTIATLGLYATDSSAQIFDLKVTNYGGIPAELQTFVDTELDKIENDINKDFPSGTPDRLMEGMANSSVMAAKGIGTDYASNMDVFLIGAGVGVGADLEKPAGTDSEFSGVGVAPGLVVGLNLGFIDRSSFLGMDPKRLNIYFNFMSYNYQKKFENDGKNSEAGLDLLSFGSHIRYNWIKPRGNRLLGWGGVKVNLGFEYNKTEINFKTEINETVDTTSSTNEDINGTLTGTPEASILASTTSIPLALSTDVQILYFLSVYTGAAVDYNMGTAKGKGNLNANESDLTCTGGAACGGAGRTISVQPTANLNTSAKVDPFLTRGFVGVQANLPWTRIFVQVDKAFGKDLIGATAGLRFAF
jgi:hypothetical protein